MDSMASEGCVPVVGGKIWYRKGGDGDKIPLLVIHGGPGYPHDYLRPLEDLGLDRPIIFYDQLGCGKSDRPDDTKLWTIDRFRDEVSTLLRALSLKRVHILGHSWGGILAVEYTLAFPLITQSLILASPCLSTKRWIADTSFLINLMPGDIRNSIYAHQADGTIESKEYLFAVHEYEQRYVCRVRPEPTLLQESKKNMNESIYLYMWGPTEFFITGTLRDYDCTRRLPEISCQVLFTCGRYDEVTPQTTAWYSGLIPHSKTIVFEHSAHMAHLEETESYLNAVQRFLQSIE